MRFSAAIHQVAPHEAAPAPVPTLPAERAPSLPQQPVPVLAQEPPPDLDQRVRQTGEW